MSPVGKLFGNALRDSGVRYNTYLMPEQHIMGSMA